MHPVLFTVPLPGWPIPLGVAFAVLAALCVVVALLGGRGGLRELTVLGALSSVLAVALAVRFRGGTLRLEALPVYSFGLLLGVAILVGALVTRRLARREGLGPSVVDATCVVSVAAGLVGARLFYVASNAGDFATAGDALSLGQGGLALHGGLLFGIAGAVTYLKRSEIRVATLADAAAPGVLSGLALGHFGSYLAGADYGRVLDDRAPAWLARLGTFPRWPDALVPGAGGPPVLVDQVLSGQLPLDAVRSLPVHPTQLYEALGALGLTVGLLAFASRRPFRGAVALVALGGQAALRFSVETLRADSERGLLGPPLSLRWTAGLTAFLLGALVWVVVSGGRRGDGLVGRRVAALVAIGVVIAFSLILSRAGAGRPTLPASVGQWVALGCLAFTVPAFHVLAGRGLPGRAGPFTPGAPPS